jgi:DNA-binding transcriptional ArsR family regulator
MAAAPDHRMRAPESRITGITDGGDTDLASIGAILADPRRCRILLALDDGRALAASQLAMEAGVTAATASSHLGKMFAAGLLTVEAQGRNRYYRISRPEIGRALELLSQLAPAAPVRSLRQGIRAQALREARTCWDHLAGQLGVALMDGLVQAGHLTGRDAASSNGDTRSDPPPGSDDDVDYRLSSTGVAFLADFGILVSRRPVVRHCIDWSERRPHLSGVLGRGLLDRLIALAWIQRTAGSRAVTVTDAGRKGIAATFNVMLPAKADSQRWAS